MDIHIFIKKRTNTGVGGGRARRWWVGSGGEDRGGEVGINLFYLLVGGGGSSEIILKAGVGSYILLGIWEKGVRTLLSVFITLKIIDLPLEQETVYNSLYNHVELMILLQ